MEANLQSILDALSSHRINTLTELRRMERILVSTIQSHVLDERGTLLLSILSSAWMHYVRSNNLLNELRNLTRNYPFSSEMLDEARTLVLGDTECKRSWNPAWLVLAKIEEAKLVEKHARTLATKPEMWGGSLPEEEMVTMLQEKCRDEWKRAVEIMLRHWETPPLYPGQDACE